MPKLTCPICGGEVAVQRDKCLSSWNLACWECGLWLYGPRRESRKKRETKWRKMRSAEPIISVEPPE